MWWRRSIHAGRCTAVGLLLACSSPTEPADEPQPGELVVAPQIAELPSGSSRRFKATVRSKNGRLIAIKGVSWLSSNAAVARIDQQGTLVAHQAGTAQVTARWNGAEAAATVIVIPSSPTACSNLQMSARAAGSVAFPCPPDPGTGKRKRPSDLR
ncbi:MAG: Ig-like domain-containing protein [Gemmatimonadales bacterium]